MATPPPTVQPGTVLPARTLTTMTGRLVPVPDPGGVVHLQFRRFAGCPVCNLHLRSFARRLRDLDAAGVREVVLFHSTAEDLMRYEADLPFAVVPDPGKHLYRAFGVESSPLALLHPRAWWPILRAVGAGLWTVASRRGPMPPVRPAGGRYGLPADFLVDRDGRVLAAHYGAHVDDHWSVDQVLASAAAAPRAAATA